MFIEFRVSNYRSIAEEQVLSMVPAPKQRDFPDNIIQSGKYEALNTIGIYGANASGKSNVLKAMDLFGLVIKTLTFMVSGIKGPYDSPGASCVVRNACKH
jgi:AAA15 family ATPase/GTPase